MTLPIPLVGPWPRQGLSNAGEIPRKGPINGVLPTHVSNNPKKICFG